jgi:hypothetical protein
MNISRIACAKTLSLAGAFALSATLNLSAQVYVSSEATVYDTDITALGQGNNAIVTANTQGVANNACVPTASANGLSYLEAYQTIVAGNPNPFSTTPDTYPTVNTLIGNMGTTASGTPTVGQMNGLYTYLQANAPGVSLSGQVAPVEKSNLPGFYGAGNFNAGFSANVQAANPSAQFLYNNLAAKNAVELGLLWGTYNSAGGGTFNYTGGHEVTLEGMNMSGGTGTMSVLDPWGNNGVGNNAGTSGLLDQALNVQTVTLNGIAGSFLLITYAAPTLVGDQSEIPVSPLDTVSSETVGFGTAGAQALVIDDAVEAVPEPSTIALVGIGAMGLMARLRRKA